MYHLTSCPSPPQRYTRGESTALQWSASHWCLKFVINSIMKSEQMTACNLQVLIPSVSIRLQRILLTDCPKAQLPTSTPLSTTQKHWALTFCMNWRASYPSPYTDRISQPRPNALQKVSPINTHSSQLQEDTVTVLKKDGLVLMTFECVVGI